MIELCSEHALRHQCASPNYSSYLVNVECSLASYEATFAAVSRTRVPLLILALQAGATISCQSSFTLKINTASPLANPKLAQQ